jgi:hypothetical protein
VERVVAVHEHHEAARGKIQPAVAGAGHAARCGCIGGNKTNARIARGNIRNDRARIVGRCVVHNEHLDLRQRLIEHAANRGGDPGAGVEHRDDDRYGDTHGVLIGRCAGEAQ